MTTHTLTRTLHCAVCTRRYEVDDAPWVTDGGACTECGNTTAALPESATEAHIVLTAAVHATGLPSHLARVLRKLGPVLAELYREEFRTAPDGYVGRPFGWVPPDALDAVRTHLNTAYEAGRAETAERLREQATRPTETPADNRGSAPTEWGRRIAGDLSAVAAGKTLGAR